ncbi:MAG TPA: 2-oxoglutarate dehydrogenase E1 component, partial [Thermoanaerobaculia bacterium]
MTESMTLPNPANLGFVEELYGEFRRDPGSVGADWRRYFEHLERANGGQTGWRPGPSFRPRSLFDPAGTDGSHAEPTGASGVQVRQDRAVRLIRAYLVRGHRAARIDPLARPRPAPPELDPAFHGLTAADLEQPISTHEMPGPAIRPLREILGVLQAAY